MSESGKNRSGLVDAVKVGPFRYTVEYEDRLQSDNNERLAGQARHMENRILLDPMPCQDRQTETLWHETIHAIADVLNISLTEDDVCRLSIGLMMVMRDNPDLVNLTMDGSKP